MLLLTGCQLYPVAPVTTEDAGASELRVIDLGTIIIYGNLPSDSGTPDVEVDAGPCIDDGHSNQTGQGHQHHGQGEGRGHEHCE